MKSAYEHIAELIEFVVSNKLEKQSLEDIAAHAGMSPTHIQKLFTDWVGVSPKQFARYLSLAYAKELLEQGSTLETAATLTGLSSTGRLHDLFVDIESVTPGEYKAGGHGRTITYGLYDTIFGKCLVATTERGVCNVLFDETHHQLRAELKQRWPHAHRREQPNEMQQTVIQFINGIEQKQKIKLHLHGTNFQLKVWEALLSIPEGEVASYGSIAKRINQPQVSRAVGAAVGDNPIGYIIPCHRVLKATGEISGYRWGVRRKRTMLEYEALRLNHNHTRNNTRTPS